MRGLFLVALVGATAQNLVRGAVVVARLQVDLTRRLLSSTVHGGVC